MKQRTEFFNANLAYFILIALFVIVRIGTAIDAFSFLGSAENIVLNVMVQVGFMFIIPVLLTKMLNKKTYKQTFKDFKFNKINWKSVLICVAIGVIVFVLNIAISSFFNFIIRLFGYSNSVGGTASTNYPLSLFLINILLTGILPGICEETAHRGMLLSGFKELGVKKAIILSSILFGLMHLNIEQFFYATIIGALLAFLCIMTNSIIPGIIIHFLNNSISVYLDFASANDYFLGDVLEKITGFVTGNNFIVAVFLILLVLASLVFLLAWLIYLLFKQTTGKKIQGLVTSLKDVAEQSELPVKKITIPVEFLGVNIHQKRKPKYVEKIFLYSTLILSIAVTVSTFIWGVL